MNNLIIAIDGYSSTGKSSVSKDLAKHLKSIHIDSGAMYRAVTLYGIQNFYNPVKDKINEIQLIQNLNLITLTFRFNEDTSANEIYLNDQNVEEEIRGVKVNQNVSKIAKFKEVREFLVHQQQVLGKNRSVVMDGRDIGTIVYPNADFKFFITASVEERTNRRYLELSPTDLTKEEVKENLMLRDKNDIEREISPLIKASDAVLIDNTFLNKEQTLHLIIDYIQKKGE